MKPIEEILRQYAGEFRNCPAAVTLFDRLQHQKQNYGNPTFTPLKEPFDVTWAAEGFVGLRLNELVTQEI
jgi:hypothetical protein